MEKFKNWIIAHKLVSIIIASVLVVGITLAIVLPLTLKQCDHVYDHACDTTCNICGETREISYYATGEAPAYSSADWAGTEMIDGVAGGQYVFKVDNFDSQYSIGLTSDRDDLHNNNKAILLEKYTIRLFDENFNELTIKEAVEGAKFYDCLIYNKDGEEITNNYEGSTVYFMFTLNEAIAFCPFAN